MVTVPSCPTDWLEDVLFPSFDTLRRAGGASDTTLYMTNPRFYAVGDVIHVPRTGENLLVSRLEKRGVVLQRGFGGTKASGMVADEFLWIIGNFKSV